MKYRISLETTACFKYSISPSPYIKLVWNHIFFKKIYAGRLLFEMY